MLTTKGQLHNIQGISGPSDNILENARHCGVSLIEYTRTTWRSYTHLTVIRMWLNLRPQKITKYTPVYTGTVSQWL